jgi:hypothetical protein
VTVGSKLEVTLNVVGHGVFGSFVETLPAGFTYLESTINPGVNGQILTFTLIGENEVKYTEVTVTIAVANYGGIGEIKDTWPEGFAYVSSEPVGATFDQSSRTVTFALVADTSFSYTSPPLTRRGVRIFSPGL